MVNAGASCTTTGVTLVGGRAVDTMGDAGSGRAALSSAVTLSKLGWLTGAVAVSGGWTFSARARAIVAIETATRAWTSMVCESKAASAIVDVAGCVVESGSPVTIGVKPPAICNTGAKKSCVGVKGMVATGGLCGKAAVAVRVTEAVRGCGVRTTTGVWATTASMVWGSASADEGGAAVRQLINKPKRAKSRLMVIKNMPVKDLCKVVILLFIKDSLCLIV